MLVFAVYGYFFELHYHVGPLAAVGILLKRHPVEGCNEKQSFEVM